MQMRALYTLHAALAALKLRQLREQIDRVSEQFGPQLDAYSAAHLDDAGRRIEQVLNATYVHR